MREETRTENNISEERREEKKREEKRREEKRREEKRREEKKPHAEQKSRGVRAVHRADERRTRGKQTHTHLPMATARSCDVAMCCEHRNSTSSEPTITFV